MLKAVRGIQSLGAGMHLSVHTHATHVRTHVLKPCVHTP